MGATTLAESGIDASAVPSLDVHRNVSIPVATTEPILFLCLKSHSSTNVRDMKNFMVIACAMSISAVALAQGTPPRRMNPADAKKHIGDTATVCGKVIDTKVPRYGLAGHGKPVSFYLEQPATDPLFYFVAFGTQPDGPKEVVEAYSGKRVCVT